MKVVLAEDSLSDRDLIRVYAQSYCTDHCNYLVASGLSPRIELLCYEDGDQLLEDAPVSVDLYLFDIEMPCVDGLTVARTVRLRDPDVPICFITGLAQLAPEGYEVDAMGFLIKPVSYTSFARTMDRAVKRLQRRKACLSVVKDGKNERYINLKEVAYAEASKRHTVIRSAQGDIICAEPLKSLEKRWESAGFFRIHNAFLVNLDHVESLSGDGALVDGDMLPVSKHRRQELVRALARYIGSTA